MYAPAMYGLKSSYPAFNDGAVWANSVHGSCSSFLNVIQQILLDSLWYQNDITPTSDLD